MEKRPNEIQSPTLTADDLIYGAWYALEQCGLLLEDAYVLIEHGSHATAAAVAMLAREELGRHEMLLGLWRECFVNGVQASVDDVRNQLERKRGVHLEKQRRSGQTVTYRVDRDGDDEVAVILRERSQFKAGTPEYRALDQRLRELDLKRLEHQPAERHQLRMSATYLNLSESGWERPCLLEKTRCRAEVTDAMNDYVVARELVLTPELLNDDLLISAWRQLVTFKDNLPVPSAIGGV
jgi:AbiV family abortive infection protein